MVRTLLAGLFVVLLSGCTYQEVLLHDIDHVAVKRFDGNSLEVIVHAVIENPNGYKVHIMDPDLDIVLNGTSMGKAVMDGQVILAPRSTGTYEVPLRTVRDAGSAPLLGGLLGVALTGRAELRLKGTVRGGAGWFIRRKVPVDETYSIDLRR